MKAMQKFQPLISKLREKYKDDPQRLNAETMKLYKEHKINPFAGCLPMVVQIPVFFALFTMLRSAVELRGASFLWIKDLSQPDTIWSHTLAFALPIVGDTLKLNPLPIAMGASMIWQMKLTPSGGDPKQQQMMMFMPLMMLYFFYSSSSGLVLYWTVQQFLSIAQQWWSMRQADTAASAVPMTSTGKTK
jgi:YidC/Oxa1 family membrane protein insertase